MSLPDSDMESCFSAEEMVDLMTMDFGLTESQTLKDSSNSRTNAQTKQKSNAEGSYANDDSSNWKTGALNEFLSVKRELLPMVIVKP